jgi:hypothetical protein
MVQLVVQRRGEKYVHANQPWHSMEPLTTNMLGLLTATGWMAEQGRVPSDFTAAPDVARLWREAGPLIPNSTTDPAVTVSYERLIPGGSAWPFQIGGELFATEPNTFLTWKFEPQTLNFTWPQWKTPSGAAWNFGQITIPGKVMKTQSVSLNWNSSVTVLEER